MTQLDDSVALVDQMDADEGISNNQILFIPFVDRNEISLMYHNRENLSPLSLNMHPEI